MPPAWTGGHRQRAGVGLAGGRWGSEPAWRLATGPPLLARRRGDARGCTPPLPAAGRSERPSLAPLSPPPHPACGRRVREVAPPQAWKGMDAGGNTGGRRQGGGRGGGGGTALPGCTAGGGWGGGKTQGRAPAPPLPVHQRQTGAAQTANAPHVGGPAAATTGAVTTTKGRTARVADGSARPRPPVGLHPLIPTGRGGWSETTSVTARQTGEAGNPLPPAVPPPVARLSERPGDPDDTAPPAAAAWRCGSASGGGGRATRCERPPRQPGGGGVSPVR